MEIAGYVFLFICIAALLATVVSMFKGPMKLRPPPAILICGVVVIALIVIAFGTPRP